MNTITVTVPANWLEGLSLDQEELRQALMLGLTQLRQQRAVQDMNSRVMQALLSTGRIRRLAASLVEEETSTGRQTPPTLPGLPMSEILVAQRRGEL
jgi:hypothetical protein